MASTDRKELAEKIVKILESATNNQELASLFASIEKINHRLDKLEATHIGATARKIVSLPHPSQEKFNIADAVDAAADHPDVIEKACTFEPNDRPCDHCAMCRSRGF
jgi:hypothetical protein